MGECCNSCLTAAWVFHSAGGVAVGALLLLLPPKLSLHCPWCIPMLQALSKNGKYLGDRYVRLLHVPKQEMEEQVRLGTLAIPGAQAKMRQKMMRGPYMDGGMRSGPYGADGLPNMLQGGQQGMQDMSGGYGHMPGVMSGMPPNMAQHSMAPPLQPGMGLGMAPGGMHPGMLPGSMAAAEQQQPLQMGMNAPPG